MSGRKDRGGERSPSKVKRVLSSLSDLFHRDEEEDEAIRDRLERCRSQARERKTSECPVPSIPRWKGKAPQEFVEEWGSLMHAENALDTGKYPLPEAAALFEDMCGGGKTVGETVKCIGDWVFRHIEYDGVHASLSREAAEALKEEGVAYPMHRYMTSGEAWDAGRGICGENSEIIVAALRAMGIPSSLYRPRRSHFAAVAEDTEKREFYVYDATSGSFCRFSGSPEAPASVVTKRWDPESNYTFGVTPYKEFAKWNLNRRRVMGTVKACQLLAGVHKEGKEKREGHFVLEDGSLDTEKLNQVGRATAAELGEVKEMFRQCADYLDGLYVTSGYYDVSADTENALKNPPPSALIKSLSGKQIVDLEHAAKGWSLPFKTFLGRAVDDAMERGGSWRRRGGSPLSELDAASFEIGGAPPFTWESEGPTPFYHPGDKEEPGEIDEEEWWEKEDEFWNDPETWDGPCRLELGDLPEGAPEEELGGGGAKNIWELSPEERRRRFEDIEDDPWR